MLGNKIRLARGYVYAPPNRLLQNATSRQGKQYGAIDNLRYAYQGNRPLTVDD